MGSFFMTDDYAARRREYVQEIRKSFDAPPQEEPEDEIPAEGTTLGFVLFKLRIVIAVLLFAGFLFLKYNDYEINGYHAKDIIAIVTDNHYYTILQDYVMIGQYE